LRLSILDSRLRIGGQTYFADAAFIHSSTLGEGEFSSVPRGLRCWRDFAVCSSVRIARIRSAVRSPMTRVALTRLAAGSEESFQTVITDSRCSSRILRTSACCCVLSPSSADSSVTRCARADSWCVGAGTGCAPAAGSAAALLDTITRKYAQPAAASQGRRRDRGIRSPLGIFRPPKDLISICLPQNRSRDFPRAVRVRLPLRRGKPAQLADLRSARRSGFGERDRAITSRATGRQHVREGHRYGARFLRLQNSTGATVRF